jgi:hypothetical protein
MIWGVCGVKLCKNVQFTKKSNPLSVKEENCSCGHSDVFLLTLLLRRSFKAPFISFRMVSVKCIWFVARFLSMAGSDLGCQLRFISLFIIRSQLVLCSNRQSHHQVPVLSLCM